MTHATKPTRLRAAQRPQLARMPAQSIWWPACLLLVAVLGYGAGFFAGSDVPTGIGQGPRAAGRGGHRPAPAAVRSSAHLGRPPAA